MMENTKINNYYIITGGPGSGKTTLLEALKKQGFVCVDEVARQILREQAKIGGDAMHTKNQAKYFDLMLSRSQFTYELVKEKNKPVFFDRGIPELVGYCRCINIPIPDYLQKAIELYGYNKNVFIAPPWKEIYRHDNERKQPYEEAVATYHRIVTAYTEAGYSLIELPILTVTERVNFILQYVQ